MAKKTILSKIYLIFVVFMLAIGFAALFTKTYKFRIPIISSTIIPVLDKHKVWGETLRGPAVLVSGEHWFFLITLIIIVVVGIMVAIINRMIKP